MSKAKLRIKKGDHVVVVAGSDRGKTGRVLRVLPEDSRLVVEGVRVVTRHQKPANGQPGGIVRKEAAIHVSNVALWDVEAGERVKVGFAVVDGKKTRVNRKTGKQVG
jgi:large subunit ribosomal protein L24